MFIWFGLSFLDVIDLKIEQFVFTNSDVGLFGSQLVALSEEKDAWNAPWLCDAGAKPCLWIPLGMRVAKH